MAAISSSSSFDDDDAKTLNLFDECLEANERDLARDKHRAEFKFGLRGVDLRLGLRLSLVVELDVVRLVQKLMEDCVATDNEATRDAMAIYVRAQVVKRSVCVCVCVCYY